MKLWATLVFSAIVLAGCATTSQPPDRAPKRAPKGLANLPDPVPRNEPKSRYGNHSPYVVFGKQYRVLASADGYREAGIASWYGAKFHGRPTSSGEPYDMYRLTAAHKSLPVPTYVRVTNLDNGKSSIVRVNDRGPFHERRIIDLSYAAAVKLGFEDRGTARVLVEVVDGSAERQVARTPARAPKPAPRRVAEPRQPVSVATVPSARVTQRKVTVRQEVALDPGIAAAIGGGDLTTQLFLQAGAFSQLASAEKLRLELVELIGDAVHIHQTAMDELYRVRIGPVAHLSEATRLQALIVTANFGMPLIVRDQ